LAHLPGHLPLQGRGQGIPFASIRRKAFAWALREAWRQVREEARIAAVPAEVKAGQAAQIREAARLSCNHRCFRVISQRAERANDREANAHIIAPPQ
jgi:hypothetical protein